MLIVPSSLWGQEDLLGTYQQVLDNFMNKKKIAYTANYFFFETITAPQANQQSAIKAWITENESYFTFENLEIIHKQDHAILVDNQQKVIQLQKGTAIKMPTIDWKGFVGLVETFQMQGTVYQTSAGYNGIRFKAESPSLMKFELEYDTNTGLIYRIFAVYDFSHLDINTNEANQQKLEIVFTDFQLENISPPVQMQQVIQTTHQPISGLGAYKDYRILR